MKNILTGLLITLLVLATLNTEAQRDKKNSRKTTVTETPAPPPIQTEVVEPREGIQLMGETAVVEAKGVGLRRDDALQDALRNAVGQAVGVSVTSETRVENYMILQDAIASRTQGYIASYDVLKETPLSDRYEVFVRATVSLSPLKADINTLSRAIGGVRFLVMYDDRNIPAESLAEYDFAVERVNEFLANRGYRYIEKKRFDQLKREARGIGHEIKPGEESYIRHLGMMADAQFIIFISKIHVASRSEAFDTKTSSRYVVEVKAYDNCTAEGLGTTMLESNWNIERDQKGRMISSIQEAVSNDFDKLTVMFTRYIGSWVNNGTPFELRFYQVGTYRDFRTLRNKLQEDPSFGGDMEIVSVENYTKLNCTYKYRPEQLADKILDIADAIPEMKDKILDVKLIYGRQINFAPQRLVIPELQIKTE